MRLYDPRLDITDEQRHHYAFVKSHGLDPESVANWEGIDAQSVRDDVRDVEAALDELETEVVDA